MIKSHSRLIAIAAGAMLTLAWVPAFSAVPQKKRLDNYKELWTKSPFTVPPPDNSVAPPEENPLDDYTLAGACEMKGGWFVVLINKKEREKRVRIRPGVKNPEGFEVVSVERGDSYMDTKVQIQTRSGKRGSVEYDKKFIVLRKASPKAAPKQPAAAPGQRPGTRPGQPPVPTRTNTTARPPVPSSNNSSSRPRVRRIPNPPSR